jgi:hypothetical protein
MQYKCKIMFSRFIVTLKKDANFFLNKKLTQIVLSCSSLFSGIKMWWKNKQSHTHQRYTALSLGLWKIILVFTTLDSQKSNWGTSLFVNYVCNYCLLFKNSTKVCLLVTTSAIIDEHVVQVLYIWSLFRFHCDYGICVYFRKQHSLIFFEPIETPKKQQCY